LRNRFETCSTPVSSTIVKTTGSFFRAGEISHAACSIRYLVTRHDDGFGKVYPLLKGTRYSIGRAPTNKIVLGDDLCSREHAEIYFADGHWVLRDLGSLNGSRINNEQVRGEEQISSSDDVQLGRSRFLYVDDLAELPGIPDSGHGGEKLEIRKRLRTTRYGNSHV
jgi:hypothetical protein